MCVCVVVCGGYNFGGRRGEGGGQEHSQHAQYSVIKGSKNTIYGHLCNIYIYIQVNVYRTINANT